MYAGGVPDDLPPLNALRTFAVAARQRSFTRAAQELHVTQTAVSHQIRLLEEHLGVSLFLRLPRRLELTAEGEAYARELSPAFDRVADATAALKTRPRREILAVTTMPSLATCWLTPRLGDFIARHPRIDVRLISTERFIDFAREPMDVGIRFGYGRYAGLRSERLMEDELFPVCSPTLLRGPARRRALDLRRHPLLHDDSTDNWRRWLRAARIGNVDPEQGHIFSDASLTLQAAAAGLGVAMGRRVLVEGELAAGRLVRPFALSVPCDPAYYLVTLDQTAALPRVRAFRAWVVSNAAGPSTDS
ncbi:MAG TPA: transcriptional regulator GcvA [Polyangia bacterium]|nr:transcriptional regulator GcvA [Polyangia bacterium]